MKGKAYKLLMLLQGVLWLMLTLLSLWNDRASTPVLILMVLNAAAFIVLSFANLQRLLFKLAVPAFLLMNALLSVTDQMGAMDILVLVWDIALLVLSFLIIFHKQPN